MERLRNLVPASLRELVTYVSPAAFRVIPWKGLVSMTQSLSKGGQSNVNTAKIIEFLQLHVETEMLRVIPESTANFGLTLSKLNQHDKQRVGESILTLYFSQLYCEEGFFLDLRPKKLNFENGILSWNPGIPFKFNDRFRQGIIALYQGFFEQDEAQFDRALEQLELVQKNWSTAERLQLKDLLKQHFGKSIHEEMVFRLDDFQQSFHELFVFFQKVRFTIPSDFLTIGMYLVALYLSLDPLKVPLNVHQVFQDTLLRTRKTPNHDSGA